MDYPSIVAVDGLRYAIPASIAFAVFWIWKWDALAHRRIQARRPSRKAFAREIRYSILTTLIFAGVGWTTVQLQHAGVVEIYPHVAGRGLGIELYPKWFARSRWTRWITTSTHHNLHHRDFEGNYGLYFTWWDRLMTTQHAEYQETFARVTAETDSRRRAA